MQALKLALAKKPVLTPPLHVRALEAQRPLQLWGTVRSPSLTGPSISHNAQGSREGAAWHPSPNPDPDQRSWETAKGRGARVRAWRWSASNHLCLLLSSPDYGLPGAGALSISFLVPSDTLNGLVYQVSP